MTATLDPAYAQRRQALDHANQIRALRSQARREIRTLTAPQRRWAIAYLLCTRPWWVRTMPVHLLLRWAPGLGPRTIPPLLRRHEIRPVRPVGRLTERQGRTLATTLVSGCTR